MKKILITGVCGFIGYSTAQNILSKTEKFKIIGVDNLNDYYSPNLKKQRLLLLKKNKNFIFYKIDISDEKKVNKIFSKYKIDLIIHLAAQAGVRYSISNPDKYIKFNTVGFFNILNASRKYQIKKIIYASSSSVYGSNNIFPSKEKYFLKPNNIYSLTKKNNEEIAEIFSHYYKLNLVGLRFFTVFGEWGRPDMMIMKYIKASYDNKTKFYLYNKGNHIRDLTYIGDINKILYKLINKNFKAHQIFNVCSNKPIKITKVLSVINNFTKKKPQIFKIKKQKADLIKTHGDNKKINKYLNFKSYTNFETAIEKLIYWYKKRGNRSNY